jgi:hypothetical protein
MIELEEKLQHVDHLQRIELDIHEFDQWVTKWSWYVGEESLGKIRIKKSRFGLHTSVHESGKNLVSGIELDSVIKTTYCYLKWERDGYDGLVGVKYESVVGGKL